MDTPVDTKEVVLAASIAGGVLGTLHHQLKPLQLHPVANYTIGSTACLTALSCVLIRHGQTRLAFLTWLIWAIAGGVVALTYVFDGEAQIEIKEAWDAATAANHTGP